MRTNRRKKERPSRDQVRAWLTTVISPLVSALTVERERVSRGNWSFRCHTQDFEFLWPIEKMVAVPYAPNLSRLLRYRNRLQKLAHDHDRALDSLRTAARGAYNRLTQHQRFRVLASQTGVSEGDQRYFAEYVVNRLRDLASYYAFHELWDREGEKFLALREDPRNPSTLSCKPATAGNLGHSGLGIRSRRAGCTVPRRRTTRPARVVGRPGIVALPLSPGAGEMFERFLEMEGPPSVADALLAAECLALEIPVVTRNVKDFKGVPGLHYVAW